MSEWKPIETAPKDGSVLLLLSRLDGALEGCEAPEIGHFIDGDWHNVAYCGDRMRRILPIAWMNRPEFVLARSRFAAIRAYEATKGE